MPPGTAPRRDIMRFQELFLNVRLFRVCEKEIVVMKNIEK
jgi:hypothetical protein